MNLFRYEMILRMTQSPWLVNLSPFLMTLSFSLLGERLASSIIRPLFYEHFCGGETEEEVGATVRRLEDAGFNAVVDYAAECELPRNFDFYGTNPINLPFDMTEKLEHTLEENTEGFLASIRSLKGAHSPHPHMVAIKATALLPPMVLLGLAHQLNFSRKLPPLSASPEEGERSLRDLLPHQMGEELDKFWARMDRIVAEARVVGGGSMEEEQEGDAPIGIFVDAEHSFFQPAIDSLVLQLQARYNRSQPTILNTYQLYLSDSEERLREDIQFCKDEGLPLAFKMVRGAYRDLENRLREGIVLPSEESTHQNYNAMLVHAMQHMSEMGGRIMVASHNEQSVLLARDLISSLNLNQEEYEHGRCVRKKEVIFGQLFGMADHLTAYIADQGLPVYKYLPFGSPLVVSEYMTRRAKENLDVMRRVDQELGLIKQERKRRRKERATSGHSLAF
jgi:proline dehydrogenase